MTHICVSKQTIIGSDNGLSPDRRQAIIWTNAGLLLIGPLGTNLSEILIEILTFSFKKIRLKVPSAKRRPFCLGLNVLKVKGAIMTSPYRTRQYLTKRLAESLGSIITALTCGTCGYSLRNHPIYRRRYSVANPLSLWLLWTPTISSIFINSSSCFVIHVN